MRTSCRTAVNRTLYAWDGRDSEGHPLASGVYLYRLVSTEGVLTRKLILLR